MAYTLRQLNYAIAVVDLGSITQASKKLGISQPAISAALNELEREFALTIFARRPAQRISLTPAGQRFIDKARLLLDRVHDFETDAIGLRREIKGKLEIGCFAPTAPFMIPLIIAGLSENYPDIELHLHESDLDELNRGLASSTIDAALTYDLKLDRGVRFEPLVRTPVYALLSASDPLASEESVSLYDLAERPMIAFDLPITGQFFRSPFQSLGLQPRVAYQVKSYEMVRGLVGAGVGFSLLIMRPTSDQTYEGKAVVCRPLREPLPSPHYGVAFNAQSLPTRLVGTFAEHCHKVIKEEGRANKFFVRG